MRAPSFRTFCHTASIRVEVCAAKATFQRLSRDRKFDYVHYLCNNLCTSRHGTHQTETEKTFKTCTKDKNQHHKTTTGIKIEANLAEFELTERRKNTHKKTNKNMSIILHNEKDAVISCVPIPSDVSRRILQAKGSAAVLSVSGERVKVAASKIIELPIVTKMSLGNLLSKKNAKTTLDESILSNRDLLHCIEIVADGNNLEAFLRAQTFESSGGTVEERNNDASRLWPMNFPTLKAIACNLNETPDFEYDLSILSEEQNDVVINYFKKIPDKAPLKDEVEEFRLNLVADESDNYPTGFTLQDGANIQGVHLKPGVLKKMHDNEKRAKEEDDERTLKRMKTKDALVDVTSLGEDSSDIVLRVNLRDAKVTTDANGKFVIVGTAYSS